MQSLTPDGMWFAGTIVVALALLVWAGSLKIRLNTHADELGPIIDELEVSSTLEGPSPWRAFRMLVHQRQFDQLRQHRKVDLRAQERLVRALQLRIDIGEQLLRADDAQRPWKGGAADKIIEGRRVLEERLRRLRAELDAIGANTGH